MSKKLHLRCLAGFWIRLCISLPLGWSTFWLDVILMTVTQSNWRTNERTTDCMGIINISYLFRGYCFCINSAFFLCSVFILWISKYEVCSFKIQWKFSTFRRLFQSKQSKFKANENYPTFPSFWFCLYGQIENSEILRSFLLL